MGAKAREAARRVTSLWQNMMEMGREWAVRRGARQSGIYMFLS
jgi:hypothetical protein